MKPITVPKVPAVAVDGNPSGSELIQRPIDQLQDVLGARPGSGDRMADMKAAAKRVKTEGQASAFMLKAMMALHPEGSTRPSPKSFKGAAAIRTKGSANQAATSSRKAHAGKK